MNKTYSRLMLKSVKGTFARFLSIMLISMLGVGFLCGLLATTPDMQNTADSYYDKLNMFDFNVRSQYGVTEEDVLALAKEPYIEKVTYAYVTDAQMISGETSFVTRIFSSPLNSEELYDINAIEVIEGRLPQNKDECVIASPSGAVPSVEVGETISLDVHSQGYEDYKENYSAEGAKVVGIVRSPLFVSIEKESSSVGTGEVQLLMFVHTDFYALDVFTDIFLTVSGAREVGTFEEEYYDIIEGTREKLEKFGEVRSQVRLEEIKSDAQEELDEEVSKFEKEKADAYSELSDAKNKIDNGFDKVKDGENEIKLNRQKLTDGFDALQQAELDLDAQISKAKAELESNKDYMPEEVYLAQLKIIETNYDEGLAKINAEGEALISSLAKLDKAEKELKQEKAKLKDAKSEYDKNKAKADKEFADAQKDIDEAQSEIDELELKEWYITDREDNVSFNSYKGNSEKVAAIAKVFPIFFFTVAALVALTTMTRMIEEERLQIGTLKALGYSKIKIMFYYLTYSLLATLLGGIVGSLVGFRVFPSVIANAYSMMYSYPKLITEFYFSYSVVTIGAMLLAITAATLGACLSQLSEKPSTLLLPKAPAKGKRILLEHISFIWKRLSFTKKVAARNVFRYKKRLLMTIIGICGCTALLVTGFGIRDSINDIMEKQFSEINQYDLLAFFTESDVYENDKEIRKIFDENSAVERVNIYHSETVTITSEEDKSNATLFVAKDYNSLVEDIILKDRLSQERLEFTEDSIVLTEKMCMELSLEVGDTFTVTTEDGITKKLVLTDICEYYVQAHIFMSAKLYSSIFAPAEFQTALITMKDNSESAHKALTSSLLETENVLGLRYTADIRTSFYNMVKSIDYIVVVLIICAGALAVIVLYNLTNINICERRKELATMKVLGFYDKDVSWYIFRETTVLSILGATLGLLLGIWLHSFVVVSAETDAFMFSRELRLTSFVYSFLITMFFTFVVDLLMIGKLKKINMVESMKANE